MKRQFQFGRKLEGLAKMTFKKPNNMEECLYFTNRTIDSGRTIAWVFRKECRKCKKGFMNKPAKKGGKFDKKADYFEWGLGYEF